MTTSTIPARKVDRRIERTRHLLRDALMSLILEKGYNDITIQDIADRANVARTTFYLHFTDKEDLLFNGMREIYEDLLARAGTNSIEEELKKPVAYKDDFEHVKQHADFYRVMLDERGSPAFLKRVRDLLASWYGEFCEKYWVTGSGAPKYPPDLLGYLCAGAEIGAMSWWLQKNNMQLLPEEIARMCQEVSMYGMLWAMNRQDLLDEHTKR